MPHESLLSLLIGYGRHPRKLPCFCYQVISSPFLKGETRCESIVNPCMRPPGALGWKRTRPFELSVASCFEIQVGHGSAIVGRAMLIRARCHRNNTQDLERAHLPMSWIALARAVFFHPSSLLKSFQISSHNLRRLLSPSFVILLHTHPARGLPP